MRLTNALRDKIKAKLINDHFQVRRNVLSVKENDLAIEAWKQAHEPHCDTILEAPGGFFEYRYRIRVRCNRMHHFLDFMQKMPVTHANSIGVADIDEKLHNKVLELSRKKAELRSEVREMEREIDHVLQSVNTIKQLRIVWPELAPILDEIEHEKSAPKGHGKQIAVPQTMIDKLNADLGLRKEDATDE